MSTATARLSPICLKRLSALSASDSVAPLAMPVAFGSWRIMGRFTGAVSGIDSHPTWQARD